jgi:two-component system, NtrC family, sensor kinase
MGNFDSATSENGAQEEFEDLQCRLLLVEDNEDVANATHALLESLGCNVERADSAEAALRILDRGSFDVVVSDIEMPGDMDGIEFASMLGRRHPSLPVVLITGYASRLDQAKALNLEVLPKPCPPATLRSAIGRALHARPSAPAEGRNVK